MSDARRAGQVRASALPPRSGVWTVAVSPDRLPSQQPERALQSRKSQVAGRKVAKPSRWGAVSPVPIHAIVSSAQQAKVRCLRGAHRVGRLPWTWPATAGFWRVRVGRGAFRMLPAANIWSIWPICSGNSAPAPIHWPPFPSLLHYATAHESVASDQQCSRTRHCAGDVDH